jgi:hypothetical protein
MNTYRNKKTGAILVIASEFGNTSVWEKIDDSPAPVAKKPVKAEPKEEKKEEAPKKTTARKAVKK